MAKELYLYSQIYDFIAQDLMQKMEDNQGEDLCIRVCSPGGSVFAGWGIIAKMGECEGSLKMKVDGMAASMAMYLLLFCDDVEGLDVSTYVVHRADMYVGDPEDQAFLNSVNAKLKAKMLKKIDADKFKEITGSSIEDVFNPDTRINVTLNAKQAKDIGLITSIKKVTPAIRADIKAKFDKVSSLYKIAALSSDIEDTNKNPQTMTKEDLKAKFPTVYDAIFAEGKTAGKTEGIAEEKDRVSAALVFSEVDLAGVKAAIESGKPLTQTQMAEFTLKAVTAKTLTALKKEGEDTVVEVKDENGKVLTDKEKELKAFEEAVDGKGKKVAAPTAVVTTK